MVGKTEHHIRNSKDFVEQLSGEKVEDDAVMVSYDVSALFTSISALL